MRVAIYPGLQEADHDFQGGDFVAVLPPKGNNPAARWKKTGKWDRVIFFPYGRWTSRFHMSLDVHPWATTSTHTHLVLPKTACRPNTATHREGAVCARARVCGRGYTILLYVLYMYAGPSCWACVG